MQKLQTTETWTEKYRPHQIQDIYLPLRLQIFVQSYFHNQHEIMPNLFMVGPPGSGKTSLALALARHYFLKIHHLPCVPEKSVLCLNAATQDAMGSLLGPDSVLSTLSKTYHPTYPQLMRFVIVDEVEQLNFETQLFIRNIINEQSRKSKTLPTNHPLPPWSLIRFLFLSNTESEVFEYIGALRLRFYPPTHEDMYSCLWRIVQQEKLESLFDYDDHHEELQRIVQSSQRDFRRAIHQLQKFCSLSYSLSV